MDNVTKIKDILRQMFVTGPPMRLLFGWCKTSQSVMPQ